MAARIDNVDAQWRTLQRDLRQIMLDARVSTFRTDTARVQFTVTADSAIMIQRRLEGLQANVTETLESFGQRLQDAQRDLSTRLNSVEEFVSAGICKVVIVQSDQNMRIPLSDLSIAVGNVNPPEVVPDFTIFRDTRAVYGPREVRLGVSLEDVEGGIVAEVIGIVNNPDAAAVSVCHQPPGAAD